MTTNFLLVLSALILATTAARADALRCDAYYNGVQYYVTSGVVTATALEGVMVDEDYVDNEENETQNFGQCALKTDASGAMVAHLGLDTRDLILELVLPAGAPWHKGSSFTGALRVDYSTGHPYDVPATCQVL